MNRRKSNVFKNWTKAATTKASLLLEQHIKHGLVGSTCGSDAARGQNNIAQGGVHLHHKGFLTRLFEIMQQLRLTLENLGRSGYGNPWTPETWHFCNSKWSRQALSIELLVTKHRRQCKWLVHKFWNVVPWARRTRKKEIGWNWYIRLVFVIGLY